MQKSLADEHPELYHYTNAAGLAGIIQSQSLWATHYAYLNDSEEIKYFHKDQMPDLVKKVLNEFIKKQKLPIEQELLIYQDKENVTKTLDVLEDIIWNKRNEQDPLVEPFVTSFCSIKNNNEKIKDHGLLSQWRGYGQDGGFAIVFDTTKLFQLLVQVRNKWEENQSGNLFIDEVMYSSESDSKFLKKFNEDLSIIRCFILNYFKGIRDSKLGFFSAFMRCSCWYKHWGFEEENEVRIIAIPHPNIKEFQDIVSHRIPRKLFPRNSTLVPYIDLFEDIAPTSGKRLPIKRIIVGPFVNEQERKKRIRSVQILLDQFGIEGVTVTASEIPYIG